MQAQEIMDMSERQKKEYQKTKTVSLLLGKCFLFLYKFSFPVFHIHVIFVCQCH
jgi:hypothetical protein